MKLTEEDIRRLTMQAIEQLGDNATPDEVKKVVSAAVTNLGEKTLTNGQSDDSGKVILTSFGMNHPGIVAGITKILSEASCDIQDISQKIMGDFYTMIMIIDITNSPLELKELQEELNKIANQLKVKLYLQHEDVFRFMHRI